MMKTMNAPRPLNILHLTAGSDAGGLSRYIFELCAAMHERGHRVAVAGERGAWHGLFEGAAWPWVEAPLKGGPLGLWEARGRIAAYLRDHPVDVIHTHYRKATLVARMLQRRGRPPVLYTVHLTDIDLRGPRRWLSDFGDHTHVAAMQAVRWATEAGRVPADRVTLIPHGVHAERFPQRTEADRQRARAELGLSSADRVALYVGRLDDPKNEAWLLDLAARYSAQMPDLRILLAGEGPHEAALRQRIESERLGDRVRLLGHREPLPLYQAADALLLPSAREGFSYACAEAMCVGVPVLRTRTAGTEELIVENVTGRSTPIDREAFLAAAGEFLADLPALARMGTAAAGHIRRAFTFEIQLEQTLRLYQQLADASE